MAETIFGATLTLSTGRIIPTRWVGEQHVKEDLGFIPSFADWVKAIRPEPWMGRAERIETDELVPGIGGGHGPLYTVAKVSAGVIHDWQIADNVRFGIGAQYSVNRVPAALEPIYGGDPEGGTIFLRLKID